MGFYLFAAKALFICVKENRSNELKNRQPAGNSQFRHVSNKDCIIKSPRRLGLHNYLLQQESCRLAHHEEPMQEWNVRVEDVRVEKRYGKGGKSTKRVKA